MSRTPRLRCFILLSSIANQSWCGVASRHPLTHQPLVITQRLPQCQTTYHISISPIYYWAYAYGSKQWLKQWAPMAELPGDGDGFPSPEAHSNPRRAPSRQCSSWIICHLQPVLTSLINITTTDKILVGLRIQMDPGCEFCVAFRSPLQS